MTQRIASPENAPHAGDSVRRMRRLPGRPGRHVLLAAGVAAAALALTACGGSDSDAAGGSSDSHAAPSDTAKGSDTGGGTSTGSQPKSRSGGGGGAPSAATSEQAASGSRCAAGDLGLKLGRAEPGAGNVYSVLTFTNKGSAPCELRGFPGVSLLKGDGSAIGKPADREGGTGSAVTLDPGDSSYVALHTVNKGVKGDSCWDEPDRIKVYPPGSKQSLTVTGDHPVVCGNEFTVTTVRAGSEP
ncbi:DUF4232 domain-containing protein [Streptomyces sp. NPDC050560]|uniref:DUF4232 domain-containing protein n=1 Tax=Streptomyces sp. NPDC050560 TaxID=3365630 RepID=UPI0037925641